MLFLHIILENRKLLKHEKAYGGEGDGDFFRESLDNLTAGGKQSIMYNGREAGLSKRS